MLCLRHLRGVALALSVLLLAPWAQADDCPPPLAEPDAATLARLQAEASDHGLLWRISRGGVESYLYGTLHLGRLEWLMPGPALQQAWRKTEVLALEVDLSQPAALAADMKKPRSAALTPGQARRMAAAAKAACVPEPVLADLAAQPPLMQVVTLSMLAARRDGLEAGYGQDLLLAGMAQASQRPVVGLETMAEQMHALNDAGPKETAILIEEGLDEIDDPQGRAALIKLTEAWAGGRLELLATYEDWCHCAESEASRAWLRRLNDGRNPALAARIEALHERGRPVLVGVGALHMTGTKALPRLLAEKGFKVERIH